MTGVISIFSLILIVSFIFGFFVLARVFRAAASRNPNAEEDQGYQSGTGARQAALLVGTGLAVGGILSGIGGAIAATSEFMLDSAVPGISMGILLGLLAYYLGARRLGSIAVVLSAAALIIGVGISQGALPFIDRTDHNLPAVEPSSSDG
ncbi:MAG: hypothetical protein M3Q49_06835 [Actinomycetota bacterium]|nr:hypothetical protein [Actinomycetota bacterium]MDP9485494.1 hypothetical protein [Actinomycetota bacterium]PLS82468.1 MAG: hypothetical protein CYG60_24285 [Actinomycetota bacterium]